MDGDAVRRSAACLSKASPQGKTSSTLHIIALVALENPTFMTAIRGTTTPSRLLSHDFEASGEDVTKASIPPVSGQEQCHHININT